MGFIRLLIRVFFWLLLATWLGRRLLAWLFGSEEKARARAMPRSPSGAVRQLYRDPVCGTHVPEELAVTLTYRGQVQYFCSPECREKFRAANPGASSAASA